MDPFEEALNDTKREPRHRVARIPSRAVPPSM